MTQKDERAGKDAEARAARRCRSCGAEVAEGGPEFPFCSRRCRMADLGKWFSGEYRISREIKDSDLETVD